MESLAVRLYATGTNQPEYNKILTRQTIKYRQAVSYQRSLIHVLSTFPIVTPLLFVFFFSFEIRCTNVKCILAPIEAYIITLKWILLQVPSDPPDPTLFSHIPCIYSIEHIRSVNLELIVPFIKCQ